MKSDTAGIGRVWKPFRRSVYTPSMQFEARLRLDSSGIVTVRSLDDSVQLARATFNMLARDYVKADSARYRTNIGITDGHAIVEMRAWLAGVILASFLLVVGLVAGLRRVQRLRREEQREAERVAEQRHAAEAAREAERQRLARDLHDGVLQMIYAIRLHLPGTSVDPGPALETVDGLLVQTAEQVRALTAQLSDPVDGVVDFAAGLRVLLARYPGLAATVEVDPRSVAALALDARRAAYRIVQEGVSNAVRHGSATRVDIALAPADGGTHVLTLADDGTGFDPAEAAARTDRPHHGLTNLRERAEAQGGTLALDARPGAGTRVVVTFPGHSGTG